MISRKLAPGSWQSWTSLEAQGSHCGIASWSRSKLCGVKKKYKTYVQFWTPIGIRCLGTLLYPFDMVTVIVSSQTSALILRSIDEIRVFRQKQSIRGDKLR